MKSSLFITLSVLTSFNASAAGLVCSGMGDYNQGSERVTVVLVEEGSQLIYAGPTGSSFISSPVQFLFPFVSQANGSFRSSMHLGGGHGGESLAVTIREDGAFSFENSKGLRIGGDLECVSIK